MLKLIMYCRTRKPQNGGRNVSRGRGPKQNQQNSNQPGNRRGRSRTRNNRGGRPGL